MAERPKKSNADLALGANEADIGEISAAGDDRLARLMEPSEEDAARRLTIGEMARECGVTLRALRFYEGKGLLKPSREGTSRAYDATALRRLRIIVRAKQVGLSLIEIRDLLDLVFSTKPLERRLAGALDRLRSQVAQLEEQQQDVARALTTIGEEIRAIEERIGAGD